MKASSLYKENSKVMLAHEPSFSRMDSEILGFFDFLPILLPEVNKSRARSCCDVVRSGWNKPSFSRMDSEILGFFDFLPFLLPEVNKSPARSCCDVVRSGWNSTSEIERGPCSPKLTATTASPGAVDVPVKVSK